MGVRKNRFVYNIVDKYPIFYNDVEGFLKDYDIDRVISSFNITQEDLIEPGLFDITHRLINVQKV